MSQSKAPEGIALALVNLHSQGALVSLVRTPKVLVQRHIPAQRSLSRRSTLPRYPDKARVSFDNNFQLMVYVFQKRADFGSIEMLVTIIKMGMQFTWFRASGSGSLLGRCGVAPPLDRAW